MRKAFHEELERVAQTLVEMTRMASSAMTRATTALLDADIHLADSVIAADAEIDARRAELDLMSFDLLARQQPVATDLRARGLEVLSAPTPWRLDDRRPELLARWLDERVEAALEEAVGDERERVLAWHGRRRQQLRGDGVVAVVDHVDLLVLPAAHGAAGR